MTTKLSELPTSNNVTMNITEKETPENSIVSLPTKQPVLAGQQPSPVTGEMATEIMEGLRDSGGATTLPSRDIPMQTTQITNDPHMQPSYLPNENQTKDYIKQYDNFATLARQQQNKLDEETRMDSLYDNLQLPILVGVLFFLFQLPFIKKQLFLWVPSLFFCDGQPKISGFLTMTLLFMGATHLGQTYLLN